MVGVDMTGFRPVKFAFGQVHFSGGHGGKPLPMTTKTVSNDTFVKMSRTETWLVFATTGQNKCTQGSFGRTTLLEDLRGKAQKHCDGELASSSSVEISSEDYDPMNEVEQEEGDVDVSPSKTKGQGAKRARYYRNLARNSIVTLDMPVKCPEEDPNCQDFRKIRLYIVDRKTIWLHIDDVEWAVRYLYAQNLVKGVPLVPDDSQGPNYVS